MIWSRSPTHVALILDDVHVLDVQSGGTALLGQLLDELPANGRLVVAGRHMPIATARLEAQGQAIRLGETDLAFTDAELVEFAARRGIPPGSLA